MPGNVRCKKLYPAADYLALLSDQVLAIYNELNRQMPIAVFSFVKGRSTLRHVVLYAKQAVSKYEIWRPGGAMYWEETQAFYLSADILNMQLKKKTGTHMQSRSRSEWDCTNLSSAYRSAFPHVPCHLVLATVVL